MKRFIFIFSFLFLFFYSALSQGGDWQVNKSTHFMVYYKNAPNDFVEQVVEKSENYYDKIAEDLGFRRYDFWLWDERAKIYIHDNSRDYQLATGQPAWSAGCARASEKIIHTYPFAKGFFETILPHEMSHIIFREFVGFNNYAVPLWLEEGVASYQESLKNYMYSQILKQAIRDGTFVNLYNLSSLNPQMMTDSASVSLFYAEATSIVDFLVKEFGRDSFVLFCQNLRDKKNLERAIASTYPYKDIQELDRAWQEHLKNG